MSQSSREYVTQLHKFYTTCISKGVAKVRRIDVDLITIDGKEENLPSIFQIPIALPLKIKDKSKLWIFPKLSVKNIHTIENIINIWDNYLVCMHSKGKYCTIELVDYQNIIKHKARIRLYTIRT